MSSAFQRRNLLIDVFIVQFEGFALCGLNNNKKHNIGAELNKYSPDLFENKYMVYLKFLELKNCVSCPKNAM